MSTSAEQLIVLAKDACDFEESDFVTDVTWLRWANAALPELHRFVTNKYADTYFRTFDFTLAAGEYQQVLPSNFWRLKGLTVDPGTNRRRSVRPFNFSERDRFQPNGFLGRIPVCEDREYSVLSQTLLQIEPQERADGTYRLYYTPKCKLLAAVRSLAYGGAESVTAGLNPTWDLLNFGLSYPTIVNVGDILTTTGAANSGNNGAFNISQVLSATSAITDGFGYAETFAPGFAATLTSVLDPELEPFAEYVWLSMAMKACKKEESFVQAKALADQRDLIRADLEEAVTTDAGGPQTVIDVNDEGGGWL